MLMLSNSSWNVGLMSMKKSLTKRLLYIEPRGMDVSKLYGCCLNTELTFTSKEVMVI
jgi:hypothetical protein